MTCVGGAFIRLRPSLKPDDRAVLEEISMLARSLADAVDRFLVQFAVEPDRKELEG